jgi:uncharacterized membrane-anchored protein
MRASDYVTEYPYHPNLLDYVYEYPYLVSWGHLGPAPLVHAPAIVQHIAMWIGELHANNKQTAGHLRNQLFSDFINKFEELNPAFQRRAPVEPHGLAEARIYSGLPRPSDITDGPRYRVHRYECDDWSSVRVRTTFELHHEYINAYSIIELPFGKAKDFSENSVAGRLIRAVTYLKISLTDRYNNLGNAAAGGRPKRMAEVRNELEKAGVYDEIYINVWNELYSETLAGAKKHCGDRIGGAFADFRGLAVSCDAANTMEEFFTDLPRAPQRTRPPKRFNVRESVQMAHCILPFMTAEPRSLRKEGRDTLKQANKDVSEKEVTISRFLDGSCIYASTLGSQPPESKDYTEQPVTYCVLATDISSWQTGRLLRRLHALGTLRLAAMRYFSRINEAGDKLNELEHSLDGTTPYLSRMIVGYSDDGKETTADEATSEVFRLLWSKTTELLNIRKLADGLPYRVERSRYYLSQFRSVVRALRLEPRGRIEGFQPYDEFVERRFGSAYEYIDMVGKRYERVEKQLASFYDRVRTVEATRLQRETARETHTIEEFQRVAEVGFFLVAFMYYFGHSLISMLSPFLTKAKWFTDHYPLNTHEMAEMWFTVCALLLGVLALLLLQIRKEIKKAGRRAQEKKIWEYFGPSDLAG